MSPETYEDQLRRELWEAVQSSSLRRGKINVVIEKIAETKDAGFIKTIVSLLWNKDHIVVHQTIKALCTLLQDVPVRNLPDLDAELRASWPYWEGSSNLTGDRVAQLRNSRAWWAFAALASHRSGFVRQTALQELAAEETGELLPFVLLRTNDWVQQVRDTARNIVQSKLDTVSAKQWERCLPLVFRMRSALRHPPATLFEEIEKRAVSSGDTTHFTIQAESPSSFLRYRLALDQKYGRLPVERLIESAATHPVAGVRLLACDWCAEAEMANEVREKYCAALLEDKSPIVRMRAFWRIANANPEKYQSQIHEALMDKSAAVQDTARGAWKMLLHREALSFYREQIAIAKLPSAFVAALRGLRAESNVQDEALARPFLKHQSARVRIEAMRTLVGWNAPDTADLLEEALYSSSPSYSKASGALLVTRPKLLRAATVKELLTNPRHGDSQKIALRLLWKTPKWTSLSLILFAYSIPSCRDWAMEAYWNWNRDYNRNQCSPSKREACEAVEAFQAIASSPLSNNRDLLATISYLEGMK